MPVKILYSLLLAFSLIPCARADLAAATVLAALRQAHIPLADIGVEVREAHARKPLISINARSR